MNETTNKRLFSSIDIAKFFFCLCVIALHAKAFVWLPEGYYVLDKAVFRLAVPFFFVASGFFLGKKVLQLPKEQMWQAVKRYCIHLLKILVMFELINIILVFIRDLSKGIAFEQIAIKTAYYAIVHPYGSLWYIQASIIGALLLYPFVKRNKLNLAVIIGVCLFCLGLLCNSYYFIAEGTVIQPLVDQYLHYFFTARNGLFVGFIYISIGFLCARRYLEHDGQLFSGKKQAMLCLVGTYFLYLIEVYMVHGGKRADDGSMFLLHLILIPVLFFTLLYWEPNIKPTTSLMLRNLSTGMYLLQRPLLIIYSIWKIWTDINIPGFYRFILVTIVAAGLCIPYYRRNSH